MGTIIKIIATNPSLGKVDWDDPWNDYERSLKGDKLALQISFRVCPIKVTFTFLGL